MAADSQTLLGFHWKRRSFLFERMPNGLNQAPREFAKPLKPVVAFLRAQGQRLCIYLDDWFLLLCDSRAQSEGSRVPGFCNQLKSRPMTICRPDSTRLALLKSVSQLLAQRKASVRGLASLIRTLQVADPATTSDTLASTTEGFNPETSRRPLSGHRCPHRFRHSRAELVALVPAGNQTYSHQTNHRRMQPPMHLP